MKKILSFISIFGLYLTVCAQQVDLKTAQKVAENFYAAHTFQKSAVQLQLYMVRHEAVPQKSAGTEQAAAFYLFNDADRGFVMVAGDYRVSPILGYSTTNGFDTTGMPDNLRWWLQQYCQEIGQFTRQAEDAEADALWISLQTGVTDAIMGSTAVSPLVKTRWNQGWPYNNLCPYDSKARSRCPSGCVATAMAQILKFWNYPQKGVGSHSFTHERYGNLSADFGKTTYDWTHMNNTYPSGSDTVSRMAVATLMYHCGVSVDMAYDTNGSGAVVYMPDRYVQYYGFYDARTALKNYFDCDTVLGYYRSDYSLTDWTSLLKSELDAGRPILYAGTGNAGGHAFVCDGYDASGKFHMNWGWGGVSDGYFGISVLNPSALGTGGGGGGFNTNQQAVFVRPGKKETEHYDLRLYSNISISRDTVPLNGAFSITAKIANYGDSTYKGGYAVGIYKSDGSFVGYMDTKQNRKLEGGYYDSVVFSTSGMSALGNGIYYATVFCQKGSSWKEVNGGKYTNKLIFYAGNGAGMEYDLRLYSAPVASGDPVNVGNAFYISSSIGNYDVKNFNGTIAVNIYNEDGTQMGVYGQTKVGEPLNAGNYVQNFKCNFNADHGLPAGTYIASLVYTTDGDDTWHLIGDGNYSNKFPFRISDGSGYIMKLYSELKIESTNIPFNSAFQITVSIINQGKDVYEGKLAMGVFDMNDNLIDFVKTYDVTLGVKKYFNNTRFSTTGMDKLKPGNSYIAKACIFNKKSNQWEPVLSGHYTNSLTLNITGGVGITETGSIGGAPHPCPTTGPVILPLTGTTTRIIVTDRCGRLLFTTSTAETEYTMDFSSYSSGIYFIRTITSDGAKTYKVVKQ